MALSGTVTGDGTLVSADVRLDRYFVSPTLGASGWVVITTTTEVSEWVALTKSAAETWVAATPAANETRRISEDNRIVGSYRAESTIETKTRTIEAV